MKKGKRKTETKKPSTDSERRGPQRRSRSRREHRRVRVVAGRSERRTDDRRSETD